MLLCIRIRATRGEKGCSGHYLTLHLNPNPEMEPNLVRKRE